MEKRELFHSLICVWLPAMNPILIPPPTWAVTYSQDTCHQGAGRGSPVSILLCRLGFGHWESSLEPFGLESNTTSHYHHSPLLPIRRRLRDKSLEANLRHKQVCRLWWELGYQAFPLKWGPVKCGQQQKTHSHAHWACVYAMVWQRCDCSHFGKIWRLARIFFDLLRSSEEKVWFNSCCGVVAFDGCEGQLGKSTVIFSNRNKWIMHFRSSIFCH